MLANTLCNIQTFPNLRCKPDNSLKFQVTWVQELNYFRGNLNNLISRGEIVVIGNIPDGENWVEQNIINNFE